ncbi:MAG: flagellar basal body rod protein FlgC [Defluviitaleaceae bacterium]|nr:flagellar basal body rod protein FlgC [Defluviitaleaceae bacterium]
MAFFDAMNISATGLTAQRLRMDVISENIANVNTTRTLEGGPFRRKTVIFQEIQETPFSALLADTVDPTAGAHRRRPLGMGVRVSQIVQDPSDGPLVYDPAHPDANAEGYVAMPNINIVEEMVNMISASRSYEANITAINTSRALMQRTLEIGQ